MWQTVHYEPWEGRRYSEGYVSGVRVLILGDSHYGDDRRCATVYHLGRHIEGGKYQFWSAIEQIVSGELLTTPDEREKFWDSLAFANIFQSSMEKPGDWPTPDQTAIAPDAFAELVNALRPSPFTQRDHL